ncbi:hypothetical protein N657DRAFT_679516 [Parathielavia appendiculata]|uniref:Uncharacterized protein n=1 Tax=Parathielavia appendiculata TaxID=2587402 RepID=A0AAN6U562_9PEZI|nr:hypothetical protein N657DRAFT_679516 [Parathielavia appendiculata]
MPYCVWYPGLATEDTYRELARRFPALPYQVGLSIAEKARESGNDGSTAIFEHTMSQPTRHAVMDDYRRTVNPVQAPV